MSKQSLTRPNRRERRREETRQRLIEAALALMHQKPFEQVTVEEITELADVAKGTFFTYFPTKEHLLHAYMRDLADEVYEFLEALNAEKCAEPVGGAAAGDAVHRAAGRPLAAGEPLADGRLLPQSRRARADDGHRARGDRVRCGGLPHRASSSGEFRDDVPPETLAHQAIRLYRLCQMEWMMENEHAPLEQIVEQILAFYKPAFVHPSRLQEEDKE
jgi:AcrR family transcriptional regulator